MTSLSQEIEQECDLCQIEDCGKPGIRYRQRTQYLDESANWVCYCPEHRATNDEYWDEMWDNYYDMIR